MRNVHTLSRLSSTSQYGMHAGPPAYANTAPGAPSRHVTGSRVGFGGGQPGADTDTQPRPGTHA